MPIGSPTFRTRSSPGAARPPAAGPAPGSRATLASTPKLAAATRNEATPAPVGPSAGRGPAPVISSQFATPFSGSMAAVTCRKTRGFSAAVRMLR